MTMDEEDRRRRLTDFADSLGKRCGQIVARFLDNPAHRCASEIELIGKFAPVKFYIPAQDIEDTGVACIKLPTVGNQTLEELGARVRDALLRDGLPELIVIWREGQPGIRFQFLVVGPRSAQGGWIEFSPTRGRRR